MKGFLYEEIKYLFTVKEAANVLGISVHTVYKLIDSGELSAKKFSCRRTMIKAEEIERYINQK